jgi:hypothetical protein
MKLIKHKFTRFIHRFHSRKDIVDTPVALRRGVVHVRVECVVERRWRRELDPVLWRRRG